MDFKAIAQIKKAWDTFSTNHPKIPGFFALIHSKGIPVGSEIFVNITYPNGQNVKASIIVKESDIELFETLKNIRQ